MSGTVHHATLSSARPLATDVVEYVYTLDSEDAGLRWRPGQFISVNVGQQADGTPILRSYSLASRPGDGRIVIIAKLVPGGPASEWLRVMPVGERIRFTGPMGFFVLDLAHPGDVVFAATGTGVAPLLPMAEELLERTAEHGRVHLHFGLRDESDVFWREELTTLERRSGGRFSSTISLSRPTDAWTGARGRITSRVLALTPALVRPTFYLCGNGAMIRELKAGLVEGGIDRKRQIRTEAFFD